VSVIAGVKSTISAVTALTRVSGADGAGSLRQAASKPMQSTQAHEERKIDGPP
jgi:hypothetical protein